MNKLLATAAVTAALVGLAGTTQSQDKKTLAFVVNGASDFWKAAEAGVKKAQGELPNYDLVFKYPEQAAAAIQIALMDDLVASGVAGIMVSAVDPEDLDRRLNRIGGQVALFTTDSDAPNTNRIAYIGSSNTDAGKQAGELIMKALPNGGKCMGFVGLPGADNAKRAHPGHQGHHRGLEGRARRRAQRRHRPDAAPSAMSRTRSPRNPDINCMVGFYSYNTPRIYEALKDAGKLGQIKVIGFDEDPITLGGVKEGTIVGTVVQQPYEWGYQGMKADGEVPRGRQVRRPGEQADDHPDEDHRGAMSMPSGPS